MHKEYGTVLNPFICKFYCFIFLSMLILMILNWTVKGTMQLERRWALMLEVCPQRVTVPSINTLIAGSRKVAQ